MSVKSGTAFLFAASLVVVPSVASAAPPLAPAGAAGVKKAEGYSDGRTVAWIAGGALVIGGIALVLSNGGGSSHPPATTTTTTTTTTATGTH